MSYQNACVECGNYFTALGPTRTRCSVCYVAEQRREQQWRESNQSTSWQPSGPIGNFVTWTGGIIFFCLDSHDHTRGYRQNRWRSFWSVWNVVYWRLYSGSRSMVSSTRIPFNFDRWSRLI